MKSLRVAAGTSLSGGKNKGKNRGFSSPGSKPTQVRPTDGYTGPSKPKSKPTGIAPKPPQGNINGDQGQKPKRGPGNRVNRLVDAQIRAGLNDLRKERRMIRRETATERRAAKRDYERGLGDLNYIYGETADYTNALGNQIQQNYSGLRDRSQAAQSALVQALSGNSTGVAGQLTSDLSDLGISGVDASQFQADAANALNVAAQTGANNMANINAAASGAADISSLIQGMVAGSKASAYGSQLNDLNDRLFEASQAKRDGYAQVREAISDLKGTRKDLTLQMLQQLGGSQWGKYLRKRGKGKPSSSGYRSYGGGSYSSGGGGSYSSGGSGFAAEDSGDSPTLNQLLLNGLNKRR